MRKGIVWIWLCTVGYGFQVDSSDFELAQSYVGAMKQELDAFKRSLVDYDLLTQEERESNTPAVKEVKRKLLINKRIYNSYVDDIAGLAFKSLYNEIKNVKKINIKHTQSCGNYGISQCKEMAISDMRRQAIEQTSASFMESYSVVENSALVFDQIKNEFKGAIQSMEIIYESLIEGGIGYKLEARFEVEGNLPKSAIAYFKADKIIWDGQLHYDTFPSLPILSIRKSKKSQMDKLTQWLGLEERDVVGLFVTNRNAVQLHYVGPESNSFFTPITGIKAGYEFRTWRLFAKVFTNYNGDKPTVLESVKNDYFEYRNITAGLELFFHNIQIGAGGGVATEAYRVTSKTNPADNATYQYQGLYTFFEASYRANLTSHWIVDIGAEIANVIYLSDEVYPSNPFDGGKNNASTRSVLSFFIDLGYRF